MRRLALVLVVAAVVGVVPAAEGAVVPGPNGPLVFTSGRDDGATVLSDAVAQIWFLPAPTRSPTRLTKTTDTLHHRHASWSPDRTKIAYAQGTGTSGPWDIYVQDLTNPTAPALQITNTPSLREDRPTWSPDGTRLAYAKESVANFWDIVTIRADGTGGEIKVADTASAGPGNSGQFSRPQWAPNGQSIVYGKIINASPQDYDIYRAAADGSEHILGGTPVIAGTENDYQPSLSADGTRLCFTRQLSPTNKDVMVHPALGTMASPFALFTDAPQDYECAWSPDSTMIAFVRGGFDTGQILMANSDGSSTLPAPVTDVDGRFDGNPEWTRNPPPGCTARSASVAFNGFVRIPLTCTDTPDPPTFGPPELEVLVASPPAHGTLSGIQSDGSVIYTPNANFQGADTFTYTANDGTTTSPPASVAITVGPPGQGTLRISDVSVSPRRWRRGSGLPSFSARKGTRIRWTLSDPAPTTLAFQRARPGRRVGGRCLAPTRARRSRPRCTRFVRVRPSLTRDAAAGQNTLRFEGRLTRRKRLPLGTFRVQLTATDAAGNRATARTPTFRIVAR